MGIITPKSLVLIRRISFKFYFRSWCSRTMFTKIYTHWKKEDYYTELDFCLKDERILFRSSENKMWVWLCWSQSVFKSTNQSVGLISYLLAIDLVVKSNYKRIIINEYVLIKTMKITCRVNLIDAFYIIFWNIETVISPSFQLLYQVPVYEDSIVQ